MATAAPLPALAATAPAHRPARHPIHTVAADATNAASVRVNAAATGSPRAHIPCDLANAYNFGSNGLTGAGTTIAIVDYSDLPSIAADLHAFDADLGLPDPSFRVVKLGTPPLASTTGWADEIALDVEWAHAVAPAAAIVLVETAYSTVGYPSNGADMIAGIKTAVGPNVNADIVSMSWGMDVGPSDVSFMTTLDGMLPVTNSKGSPVVYLASTGDSGFRLEWPSVSPKVIGVGGTSLDPSAFGYNGAAGTNSVNHTSGAVYGCQPTAPPGVNATNERVWGNSSTNTWTAAGTGTGGGTISGYGPTGTRSIPDVAMDADPRNGGVSIVESGAWQPFSIGGTSLAAPLWAGVVSRIDQARFAAGRTGLSGNGWIYAAGSGDFTDIVRGAAPATTSDPCVATGACVAKNGYDTVTGRGSPKTAALLTDLGLTSGTPSPPPPPPTQQSLGGTLTSGPAAATWSGSRLDVFVRGADNQLWHRSWNGSAWTGWEPLGGILTSAPAAVSWGPNRIDVFARGTDYALWHKWWDGSGWSGWEPQGGTLSSAPAVASWAANRLDVFVAGSDHQLWHKWWDGDGWRGWEPQGGQINADPSAVSWGLNRIDVFVRGTDYALWHKWWDGNGWSGWEWRGGSLTSGPGATSTAINRLDVFAFGAGGLSRMSWTGTDWTSWQTYGGSWTSGPAAVSRSGIVRTLDVFERGNDSALWWIQLA